MMHRVLNVTFGYLRFTFACMAGATTLFMLAGLAISTPKAFLVVMLIGLATFFVVRSEIKTHRHALAISKKAQDPQQDIKAIMGYFALAEAATIILSDLSPSIAIRKPSVWVSDWNYRYTPPPIPDPSSIDKGALEKAEILAAVNDLKAYQQELAAHGVHVLSVSKKPARELARSLQTRVRRWSRIIHIAQRGPYAAAHPISIAFLHDTSEPIRILMVQQVLQNSFHMVERGIDVKPKSTSS